MDLPVAGRVALIDRLRTTGVLGIVAAHATVPYLVAAPAYWYVVDPERSIVFDGAGLLFEAVLVPLLFFVVGYVTPGSLARRGPGRYLGERAKRLLIPFAIGLATVVPFADWLHARATDPRLGYFAHWPRYWQYELNHGHLWFLPFAFVFALAAALARWLRPRAFVAALEGAVRAPTARQLIAFALAIGASKAALLGAFDDQQWFNSPLFNVQPSRLPANVGFFLLGMIGAFARWHESAPSRRRMRLAGASAVLLSVGYLAFEAYFRPPANLAERLADGLLHASVTTSFLIALFEFARRPRESWPRAQAALERSSYAIYVFHYVPVIGLGFLLRELPWNAGLKYALVALGSIAASWAAAEAIRRLPGASRVFG